MDYNTASKHITTIRAGDTVVHNGELRTVCNTDISRVDLLGVTLFGDSYRAGHKSVIKVTRILN